MKSLKRAAVYVRCSTTLLSQAHSIEEQLVAIRQDATRQGIEVVPEAIYSDYGKSGRAAGPRMGFQQLLEDARTGKLEAMNVSVLLLWSFDRFARNANDALPIQHELANYGIRIYSVKERTGADGKSGRWSFVFSSLIAESLSETLANQNRRAHRRKAEEGSFWAITPPYGYRRNGNGPLKLDPAETRIVRMIFRLFLSGVSLRRIAIRLQHDLVPRRKEGSKWTRFFVRNIIKQEAHIGLRICQGIIHEDRRSVRNPARENWVYAPYAHEAIIGKKDFIDAQHLMEKKRVEHNYNAVRKGTYLLGGIGILKCGKCGACYNGTGRVVKGTTYRYYGCRNHWHQRTCDNVSISARKIEPQVIRILRAIVSDPHKMKAAWDKHAKRALVAVAPARAELEGKERELGHVKFQGVISGA